MGTMDSRRARKKYRSSQNDIKKLRRENEQLKREIWCLRDEYDKLEEILKKQKNQEDSDDRESRSGDDEEASEYSEEEEQEDDDDCCNESEEDVNSQGNQCDQNESLENAENQKISSEKLSGLHRLRVNFDNLPVVNEEEELKKDNTESLGNNNFPGKNIKSVQNAFPNPSVSSGHSNEDRNFNLNYQRECPFIFPTSSNSTYSNLIPLDGRCILMCPQIFSEPRSNSSTETTTSLNTSALSKADEATVFPYPDRELNQNLITSNANNAEQLRCYYSNENKNILKNNLPNNSSLASVSNPENSQILERPKHFFAPLPIKSSISPQEKSLNNDKKESSRFGIFLSTENLSLSESNSSKTLVKSLSYQDICSEASNSRSLQQSSADHSKSDNTLDDLSAKAFRSCLTVTLKQPEIQKNANADAPVVPERPLADYKAQNHSFHQKQITAVENPIYGSPRLLHTSCVMDNSCSDCVNRADLERLRMLIPSNEILNRAGNKHEFQVTSFETPSPHTVCIPRLTSQELETLRNMSTASSPVLSTPRTTSNNLSNGKTVCCPNQNIKVSYDNVPKITVKIPAETQTSLENVIEQKNEMNSEAKNQLNFDSELQKKKRVQNEKSGSFKEKKTTNSSLKRKTKLRKQTSVTSSDAPETPLVDKSCLNARIIRELQEEKNESRSSSSGQDSPRKDLSKKNHSKKRSSLSSTRTSRSRSLDNCRDKHVMRSESNATNSERERMNSISSREVNIKEMKRKGSTSSVSVPWCACWGNGCV